MSNYDHVSKADWTCEMVDVRMFGDDEREWYEDVPCTRPAIGLHEHVVRVCRDCADGLQGEGFPITCLSCDHLLERHNHCMAGSYCVVAGCECAV